MPTDTNSILLLLLAGISLGLAFAGQMWAVIEAFKQGLGQGFLCACIPFYAWYFAMARFKHEERWHMIALVVGASVVAVGAIAGMYFTDSLPLLLGFLDLTWCLIVPAYPIIIIAGIIVSMKRPKAAAAT